MKRKLNDLTCSFCNKVQDQVNKLIAGPNHHICDNCIERISSLMLSDDISAYASFEQEAGVLSRCSFCGKRATEVWKLVTRSGSNICSECIEICNEILSDDRFDVARCEAAIVELSRMNKAYSSGRSFLRRIGIR